MSNNDFKRWSTDGRKLGTMELLFAEEAWKAATEACAAIKDAEIARLRTREYDLEANVSGLIEEIADLQRSVKELREALSKAVPFIGYGMSVPHIHEQVEEAIANSEHHNSKVLEKMLLEAEIKVLEQAFYAVRPYGEGFGHMVSERQAKLAELNKE